MYQEPSDHGSWELDIAKGSLRWSRQLLRLHGLPEEAQAPSLKALRMLVHTDDREPLIAAIQHAAATGEPFGHRYRALHPSGETRELLMRGAVLGGPGARRLVGTTQDVTRLTGEDEHLWHLANHDSLSGLFNRRRFMEELRREVAFSERTGEPGAVLMLDLDHFKDINDSLGHMAGDALLKRVAKRLASRLRSTDTLARLGGDEFAAVLPGCEVADAKRVAAQLLEAVERHTTVRVAGRDRHITASAGVAAFGPGHGRDADALLVEADLAMYRAKRTGRGRTVVFGEEMRAELAARMTLEGELRDALERHELRVHYQPIVALADGSTRACEALVRWDHPLRGMVGPRDFVSVAEEAGLMDRIDAFVLDHACAQAAEWRRRGLDLGLSVNVSPQRLARADIAAQVERVLARHALPAESLCLEVNETSLFDDTPTLVRSLEALRELGVKVAIDDFGAGASSLGLLRMVPLDQIKIDRMFIEGVADYPDDRAIVAAVLSLASELGITVVAEGVETERQAAELRQLGCELAQGFLFSRARYAAELSLENPGPHEAVA